VSGVRSSGGCPLLPEAMIGSASRTVAILSGIARTARPSLTRRVGGKPFSQPMPSSSLPSKRCESGGSTSVARKAARVRTRGWPSQLSVRTVECREHDRNYALFPAIPCIIPGHGTGGVHRRDTLLPTPSVHPRPLGGGRVGSGDDRKRTRLRLPGGAGSPRRRRAVDGRARMATQSIKRRPATTPKGRSRLRAPTSHSGAKYWC